MHYVSEQHHSSFSLPWISKSRTKPSFHASILSEQFVSRNFTLAFGYDFYKVCFHLSTSWRVCVSSFT